MLSFSKSQKISEKKKQKKTLKIITDIIQAPIVMYKYEDNTSAISLISLLKNSFNNRTKYIDRIVPTTISILSSRRRMMASLTLQI